MQIYDTFEKTVKNLKEGIDTFQQNPQHELMRDGVFFRFILTFEEARKVLDEYLTTNSMKGVEKINFPILIQLGAKNKLLMTNPDEWENYRKMRNVVAHQYDKETATTSLPEIQKFYE